MGARADPDPRVTGFAMLPRAMNQDDWLRKRARGKTRPGCGAEIGAFLVFVGVLIYALS